jgi:bacterioferritin (cytochrome b1)
MARLIKHSQIPSREAVIAMLEELINLELTSIVRFKYNEITTTGIFHDAIVPNFAKVFEDDSHHAWELAMILTSYGYKPVLNPMQVEHCATVYEFLNKAVEIKINLISKYTVIRNILQQTDPSAALIIEEIMVEERMNLNELIKLMDQRSLLGF